MMGSKSLPQIAGKIPIMEMSAAVITGVWKGLNSVAAQTKALSNGEGFGDSKFVRPVALEDHGELNAVADEEPATSPPPQNAHTG